jgi:hypothetical protein
MKRDNKRAITSYFPSPTSKPILQKKFDLKETPNKTILEANEQKMIEIEEFGGKRWCAAGTDCTNTLKAATSEIVCNICELNVHNDCCDVVQKDDDLLFYCRTCLNTTQKKNNNTIPNNITDSRQQDLKVLQVTHGSQHWCAAKKECKNHNERANGKRCANCRTFTHKECFEQVTINKEQYTYCLSCTKIEYDRQMETSNLEEYGTDKNKGEEEIVFQHTVLTPFESDTSLIRHEESFDVKDVNMNESYNENKLDNEKEINESTMIEGANLLILQELKADLKKSIAIRH